MGEWLEELEHLVEQCVDNCNECALGYCIRPKDIKDEDKHQ